jgi:hypothetical protein
MIELALTLLVLFLASLPPLLLGWWGLELHRELILLAYAVHRAEQGGDRDALDRARDALEARKRSLPAGWMARWMGL